MSAVRSLSYAQLDMLLEVLTQYEQNQGEYEACEAGADTFAPSEHLRLCRELLAECVADHHRRLGVELPDGPP